MHVCCRGLFEKDKLVFSFMLCVDIMKADSLISEQDWNYFLRGAAGVEKVSEWAIASLFTDKPLPCI